MFILNLPTQGSGISLEGSHDTLLSGKAVTFKPIGKAKSSDWSSVTLEDGIHILSKKEVCFSVEVGMVNLYLFWTGIQRRAIHD